MAADKNVVKAKAGEVIEVPDPAVVVTPSGREVRVVGGRYYALADGPHEVREG